MSRIRLKIISAEGLVDVGTFGAQSPYVLATALPGGSRTAQTDPVEGGGSDPKWDAFLGLRLDAPTSASGPTTTVRFEVKHAGGFVDTLIGTASMQVDSDEFFSGATAKLALDTGGTISLAIADTGGAAKSKPPARAGSGDSSELRRSVLEKAGDAALAAIPENDDEGGGGGGRGSAGTAAAAKVKASGKAAAAARERAGAGAGKASRRRTTIVKNAASRWLSVVVHRAEGLANAQMFGAQDPYVHAQLMRTDVGGEPRAPVSTARNAAAESGGVAPAWDDGVNDSVDFKLLLKPDPDASWLKLEVMNENAVNDDVIGSAEIRFFDQGNFDGYGQKAWYPVDTGGRLEATVNFCDPLTDENITVGCRCRRGPHWTHGSFYDGGEGGLGTVLGYRDGKGKRFGTYPARIAKKPCAVVKWDTGRKAFYPIGEEMLPEESSCLQHRYDLEAVPVEGSGTGDADLDDGNDEEVEVARARERVVKERQERKEAKRAAEAELARELQEQAEDAKERLAGERQAKIKSQADSLAREQEEAELLQAAERAERRAARDAAAQAACAAAWAEVAASRADVAATQCAAAGILQRAHRGARARRAVMLRAKRAASLLGQRLWRGVRARLAMTRRKRLADNLQRAFRGKRLLRLVSKVTSGVLFVVVKRARNLRNLQMFMKMDPYVKVTLLPSQRSVRCKCHKSGHTEPEWNRGHHNQLALELRALATSQVRVEVWNENMGGMRDDLVGSCTTELPFVGRVEAKGRWLTLQQGGEIELEMFVAHSSEVVVHEADDDDEGGGGGGGGGARGRSRSKGRSKSPGPSNRKISLLPGLGSSGFVANSFGIGFLLLEVAAVRGLPSIQFLMRQDPYVRITALPSRAAVARTVAVDGGDTDCDFDAELGGRVLCLRPPRGTEALLVEVFNENNPLLSEDELIADTRIDLLKPKMVLGRSEELELATEGTLSVTLSATPGPLMGVFPWQKSAPRPAGLGRTLVVEVHRATGIKDLMWFGAMDPLAVATLLPSRSSTSRTMCVPDGATDPEWDETFDNKLALPLDKADTNATSVCIELWNGGPDGEKIGQCEIRFTKDGFEFGKRQWFKISTGGKLRATLHCDSFEASGPAAALAAKFADFNKKKKGRK